MHIIHGKIRYRLQSKRKKKERIKGLNLANENVRDCVCEKNVRPPHSGAVLKPWELFAVFPVVFPVENMVLIKALLMTEQLQPVLSWLLLPSAFSPWAGEAALWSL